MEAQSIIDQTFEALYRNAEQSRKGYTSREEGFIAAISDGIIEVNALSGVAYFELLELPRGLFALALSITPGSVRAIVLGEYSALQVNDPVRHTGRSVSVPVGHELLGRVIDPLVRTLDRAENIATEAYYPIEQEAVELLQRDFVKEPLYTGIKIIDAMIPVGKGQRELIISDASLGKTAVAVDAIINQKNRGVLCVYVSIGQKKRQLSRVIDDLKRHDALGHTVVLAAPADSSPGMKFIAPYTGCAIAEYFRDQGKDVLIVYDDLTKHADAYRSISLLLEIPPGREAYPGDIFFIHARLLERAGKRDDRYKGGSITALPIIETQAGRISDYIPTNLISITDGQIYFDRELFNKGFLPAIDIRKSVSRIGGKAQAPALKTVAAKLKLDYSQFLEVEVFTKFGTKVEEATQRMIDRGRALRTVLKQERFSPLQMYEQVLTFFLSNEGYLEQLPPEQILPFCTAFIRWVREQHTELLQNLIVTEIFDETMHEALIGAADDFMAEWKR
jgi:F-type H+-transporting ATPase subunit alpha